jgi:hypothetical protein
MVLEIMTLIFTSHVKMVLGTRTLSDTVFYTSLLYLKPCHLGHLSSLEIRAMSRWCWEADPLSYIFYDLFYHIEKSEI